MNVEVLHWPEDEPRVAEMRTRGVARLLVVTERHRTRRAGLSRGLGVRVRLGHRARSPAPGAQPPAPRRTASRPLLDTDGLLHHRDHWVSLSPVEQSLAAALLDRFGAVVARETLAVRAWPEGLPTRNALDVHVLRLRRRIAPLGLEIRTVRARGYLLQAATATATATVTTDGHADGPDGAGAGRIDISA